MVSARDGIVVCIVTCLCGIIYTLTPVNQAKSKDVLLLSSEFLQLHAQITKSGLVDAIKEGIKEGMKHNFTTRLILPPTQASEVVGVDRDSLLTENLDLKENRSVHASRKTEELFLPYELSLPARLADAVARSVQLKRANFRSQTICPAGTGIGGRPSGHTPDLIGTVCEGWLNRETIQVLDFFLGGRMVGLEWSTGSGTMWLLQRLKFLFSVENNVEWLESTKAGIVASKIDLSRWKYAAILINKTEGGGSEYIEFPRKRFLSEQKGGFDFISVDGRQRDSCMREVLQHGLLKPYGILMLDIAE